MRPTGHTGVVGVGPVRIHGEPIQRIWSHTGRVANIAHFTFRVARTVPAGQVWISYRFRNLVAEHVGHVGEIVSTVKRYDDVVSVLHVEVRKKGLVAEPLATAVGVSRVGHGSSLGRENHVDPVAVGGGKMTVRSSRAVYPVASEPSGQDNGIGV